MLEVGKDGRMFRTLTCRMEAELADEVIALAEDSDNTVSGTLKRIIALGLAAQRADSRRAT
jgi:hypothetical protein